MAMSFSDRTVTYNQFIDDLARRVAYLVGKKVVEMTKEQPAMVPTEEAAKILGITPGRLRKIKDKFPHAKAGESKQGKLLFVRDALIEEYCK